MGFILSIIPPKAMLAIAIVLLVANGVTFFTLRGKLSEVRTQLETANTSLAAANEALGVCRTNTANLTLAIFDQNQAIEDMRAAAVKRDDEANKRVQAVLATKRNHVTGTGPAVMNQWLNTLFAR